MTEAYDGVVIGAGTAGLSAIKELKKKNQNFLLIDRGPLGTTCSRVGCMPSKLFLQEAHDYSRLLMQKMNGTVKGETTVDLTEVMKRVRLMRDHFVEFALQEIEALGDRFLLGEARFLAPNILSVNDRIIKAKAIIIATGSSPILPKEWAHLKGKVFTTDSFFEITEIKDHWAVVGLGPLGLELGSALAHFGLTVSGFNKTSGLGGLRDKAVLESAKKIFSKQMSLNFDADVSLSLSGDKVRLVSGKLSKDFDQVLVAAGRKPNLASLDMAKSGCILDDEGLPSFDSETRQINCHDSSLKLYIAGDVDGEKPILHEAADDGRIAGFNLTQEKAIRFKRRTPLTMTFSLPNLAAVGEPFDKLKEVLIGEVSFETQGRSKIMQENAGILRVFADPGTGLIRGAELCGPEGEHLAQILANAITHKLSVRDFLRQPFYHPTVEEGLRTALRQIEKQLPALQESGLELERF